MRPAVLDPLFAPLTSLKGVGPKLMKPFGQLLNRAEPRVIDLLFHLPYSAIDRRARPKLGEVVPDAIATVKVEVERHIPGRGRAPFKVITSDDTSTLEIVFFRLPRERVERMLPIGETRYVSGKVGMYDGRLQMVHPDRVLDEKGLADLPEVEPVHSLTEGLGAGIVRRAAMGAVARLRDLPEWQDAAFVQSRGFLPFAASLRLLHGPSEPADVAPESRLRARLAYDELLAHQLALVLMRNEMKRDFGRNNAGDGRLRAKIEVALPFSLTGSQRKALEEIAHDLADETRMLRLLQGDVGSGKTVVALLAAAAVIEAGRQAAIMAPTEILARQHHARIAPLANAAGIRHSILTGRERGPARTRLLEELAAGEIDLLIGTHALFQEGVDFRDLAFAVVDEQHRFGVHQRLALASKGEAVDLLVMTATPIPRTLVLTYFGDMDVSELREKPAGRTPIDTRTVSLDRLEEVVDGVGRAVSEGARAYWICPLVEESELVDLAAAEDRFRFLKARFGKKVGLVHGQMRATERDEAMAAFASGQTPILVSTTVVEVGVDVPEATVMVIEQAERFGLAQLHQLRGRVGRGRGQSTCLLLYKAPLGETARRRLAKMRETDDGFEIAEEDLALRGEGEVLGTRQSGLPGFKIARPELHRDLIETARKDAAIIAARDPGLATARGKALRLLLHLFDRDEAVRLIEAG
ncbi:MAG TPA: ATP-dependent DNA helicase RecG [Xanthobacteraceae bacterium]|nr:ATP-dependent DNA helicase RecG [Xanthobacteraceae bacterium]